MPLVLAVWPDRTISVVKMRSGFRMVELFDRLDEEANPRDAKCYIISSTAGEMHITSSKDGCDEWLRLGVGETGGKCRRLKWPEDVEREWVRGLSPESRQ